MNLCFVRRIAGLTCLVLFFVIVRFYKIYKMEFAFLAFMTYVMAHVPLWMSKTVVKYLEPEQFIIGYK